MDPHPHRGAEAHEVVERIEVAAGQGERLRLELGAVVRIAAAAHLDDDVEDSARRRVGEKIVDRLRGRDAVAYDPERLPHRSTNVASVMPRSVIAARTRGSVSVASSVGRSRA